MSAKYISINTQLFQEDEAKIHVSDLSIQRGFGIFDFLKTINGKPIFIQNHFDRFYNSAKELNLSVNYDRENLLKAVNELMEKNNMPNSGIKFILTGGFSADGYTIGEPNLVITQSPFKYEPSGFDKGTTLITYNHQRQLAVVKTIDYLQAILLQPHIKQLGADDVLYHHNGAIRECPRANFFMVKGKKIITAKTDILKGITRSKVLGMKLKDYSIVEEDFTLNDLSQADEAFITSSTKNVLPVLVIDGQKVGDGKPGKITHQLNELFSELIKLG
jgi:branched-chain amino acid aminotransferase